MFGRKNDKPEPDFEVFCIHDSKVEAYGAPVFALNRYDVIRDLINMFRDPAQAQNRYLLNAEDYTIFKIGAYWKKTGELIAHNPEHVANMIDLRSTANRGGNIHQQPVGISAT